MNSTDIVPNFREWPNFVAAIMMTTNVFLGIFFSGAVVFVFVKDGQHRTSFNMICAVRATNNIIVMVTTFVLVYIPGSLLGFSWLPNWLESFLVCVGINAYLYNEFQSIYISINRFIAIYFPFQYNWFCGHYATIIALVVLYGDRFRNVSFETYLRMKQDKYIEFSPEYLMFTSIDVYGEGLVIMGAILFGVAFSANVFTFVKIIWFYLKSDGRDNPENIKNIKKNIKLFFQTVLQDILFFIDNFFTYWMSSLINHRFWFFICATFVWQTMHVIDGFVMIMFSDRFSILKNAFTSSNSAPVSVIAEASYVKVQPRRSPLPSVS